MPSEEALASSMAFSRAMNQPSRSGLVLASKVCLCEPILKWNSEKPSFFRSVASDYMLG